MYCGCSKSACLLAVCKSPFPRAKEIGVTRGQIPAHLPISPASWVAVMSGLVVVRFPGRELFYSFVVRYPASFEPDDEQHMEALLTIK